MKNGLMGRLVYLGLAMLLMAVCGNSWAVNSDIIVEGGTNPASAQITDREDESYSSVTIAAFLAGYCGKSPEYGKEAETDSLRFMSRWDGQRWAQIKAKKGVFDRPATDSYYSMAGEKDLNIFITVYPDSPGLSNGYRQNYPTDMERYLDFIKTTAERYDGDGIEDVPGSPKVNTWEILTELERGDGAKWWGGAPKHYADLFVRTYYAIKEANPGATIMIYLPNIWSVLKEGDIDTINKSILSYIIDKVRNRSDFSFVYGIHFYRETPILAEMINITRDMFDNCGFGDTPITISDISKFLVRYDSEKEKQISNYIVKTNVIGLARDMKEIIRAQLNDSPNGAYGRKFGAGLISSTSKEAAGSFNSYYTCELMTENLEGSEWPDIETIREGVDDIYEFTKYDDEIDRTKQIRVARHNTPDYIQSGYGFSGKEITVDGIGSNGVNITEAVPGRNTGLDVHDCSTVFDTQRVTTTTKPSGGSDRQVTIDLGEDPIFIEEGYPPPVSQQGYTQTTSNDSRLGEGLQEEAVSSGITEVLPIYDVETEAMGDESLEGEGDRVQEDPVIVKEHNAAPPSLNTANSNEYLQLVIEETDIGPHDGGSYRRPEIIAIGDRLFVAFNPRGQSFQVVELNEDLSYASQVFGIESDLDHTPTDIRLATDGTSLWYAFESYDPAENEHFSNIAKYDVSDMSGEGPFCEGYILNYATYDYDTEREVLADDPTPVFYGGKYIVLARGWYGCDMSQIYTFGFDHQGLYEIDNFSLDLDSVLDGRVLSQNALVEIKGKLWLIGGLTESTSSSGIYAIPLTSDLHNVDQDVGMREILVEDGKYFRKVTAAKYRKGKLYINYFKKIDGLQYHHLGVFDAENNFAAITQIRFQDDPPAKINHSSIEVVRDKVYVVYQDADYNILAKVYKWQDDYSYDADGFMWGTKTVVGVNDTSGVPTDERRMEVINDVLKTRIVKMDFSLHQFDYDEVAGEFTYNRPDADLDEIIKVFEDNSWSLFPQFSHAMRGAGSESGPVPQDVQDNYVLFVDWFLRKYKNRANIKYIELVNNPAGRWAGTPSELVALTNRVYDMVAENHPGILVGTPGFECNMDPYVDTNPEENIIEDFRSYQLVTAYLDRDNDPEPKFDFWAAHAFPPRYFKYHNLTDTEPYRRYQRPPTDVPVNNIYSAGLYGLRNIRAKLIENGWSNRFIIDTEHSNLQSICVDILNESDEVTADAAYSCQELLLKKTLTDDNNEPVIRGSLPLYTAERIKDVGFFNEGSLYTDGRLTKVYAAVSLLWSKLNEYHYDSRLSGAFGDDSEVWVEKFKKEGKMLYIFFKPFDHGMQGIRLDEETQNYLLEDFDEVPSLITLTDINGKVSLMAPAQDVILEAENAPKFLEVNYSPDVETLYYGVDDICAYKVTVFDEAIGRDKQIWVVWDSSQSGTQSGYGVFGKRVTINDIESNEVKITEALPDWGTSEDLTDYSAVFSTRTVTTTPAGGDAREIIIELGENPLFIEEIYPLRRQ